MSTQPNRRRTSTTRGAAPGTRALWAMTIMTLVLVLLLVGAGLTYLIWAHPSLGTPLSVATASITGLSTLALTLARRDRR